MGNWFVFIERIIINIIFGGEQGKSINGGFKLLKNVLFFILIVNFYNKKI